MKIPHLTHTLILLSLCAVHFALASSLRRFSPVDNYLIDCGSVAGSTVADDGRRFVGDSSASASASPFLFASRSVSIRNEKPPPGSSPIYNTARVFWRFSKYAFGVRDEGTHVVRLHFRIFDSVDYDLSNARFHVSVNGFLLLNNFSSQNSGNPGIKEYMIWADGDKLEISFIPLGISKLAFVNAIEVFSAPKDLIADTARFVDQESAIAIDGLRKQALETLFRVTMGGPRVTPFNDSLWRTWVPDDQFLESSNDSKRVHFSGRIRYQAGGASREICPDNVYNTARTVFSKNRSIPHHNVSWTFPVEGGYRYLVRTHFCDIASISLWLLYFNVYVNGHLAYGDLDLTSLAGASLASPFYADFLVDGDPSGVLTVSVGPSNVSSPNGADAILNGVEIMKLNNSLGSLDGELSVESIMRDCNRGRMGGLIPMVAAVCLLLAGASVLMQRRAAGKEAMAWSPLPLDSPKVDVKQCA